MSETLRVRRRLQCYEFAPFRYLYERPPEPQQLSLLNSFVEGVLFLLPRNLMGFRNQGGDGVFRSQSLD